MNLILFDDHCKQQLLPLTYTRPISELRVGILTIKEKWEYLLNTKASDCTDKYLSEKYAIKVESENLLINGSILPTLALCDEINGLKQGEILLDADLPIALKLDAEATQLIWEDGFPEDMQGLQCRQQYLKINHVWDIFNMNGLAIEADFELLTKGKVSQPISNSNTIIGNGAIFLEEGAKVEAATLNASNGSIYIGKNAEIMEGCLVRGGLAMCENAVLKMGAKIYGPTTVGPYSKVGGEVGNSVLLGYSNKGHDGYLGNSVLGEWCNLGADTNTSNLKNNYAEVRLWDYSSERFAKTGLQFCGLIMGDHSKSGINTMFNTGTVVGVSSNIFGSNFPRNFIPSFAWGGHSGFTEYKLNKAFDVAEKVMARRKVEFTAADKAILQVVMEQTANYRKSFS